MKHSLEEWGRLLMNVGCLIMLIPLIVVIVGFVALVLWTLVTS